MILNLGLLPCYAQQPKTKEHPKHAASARGKYTCRNQLSVSSAYHPNCRHALHLKSPLCRLHAYMIYNADRTTAPVAPGRAFTSRVRSACTATLHLVSSFPIMTNAFWRPLAPGQRMQSISQVRTISSSSSPGASDVLASGKGLISRLGHVWVQS